jgi:hypothetical protein
MSGPRSKPTTQKIGSAGNQTRDLWICSQELWSLDHRGGPFLSHDLENLYAEVVSCLRAAYQTENKIY